ncbi:MAG: DUF4430 domain-containing protein [Agathobacter sp.]|nr:DUF4430 domain-containing protein [Agathobacter sp.]
MTRKNKQTFLSFILSMMLIVAMACNMTGCNGDVMEDPFTGTETEETVEAGQNSQAESNSKDETVADVTVLGEGDTVFLLTVVNADGEEKDYEIHTGKTIVGDALLELELISGDAGDYGLYVKTVDGVTVDYDTDGKYWAFYINGEYAMTGVDATPITEGEEYSFKVE